MGTAWARIAIAAVLGAGLLVGAAAAQEAPPSDLEIARRHFAAGRREDARVILERINASKGATAESLAILGMVYLDPPYGRVDRAVPCFDRALEKDPREPYANLGRALCFSRAGRDREAIPYFDRVIEVDPGYATAHLERGKALFRLRRFEDARKSFAVPAARMSGTRPEFPEAVEYLALVAHRLNEPARAAEIVRKLVQQLGPEAKERPRLLYQGACFLLADKQRGPARVLLAEAIRLGFDVIEAHNSLGLLCYEADDLPAAFAAYTAAAACPRSIEGAEVGILHGIAEYRRGLIRYREGDLDAALEHLRAAVTADPTQPNAWYKLGQALQRLGKRDDAAKAMARHREILPLHQKLNSMVAMLDDDPGNLTARLGYARILDALGRHREAWKQVQVLDARQPGMPGLAAVIADVAGHLGLTDVEKTYRARAKAEEAGAAKKEPPPADEKPAEPDDGKSATGAGRG